MKNTISKIIQTLNDDMAASALAQAGQRQMALEILNEADRDRIRNMRDRKRPEMVQRAMKQAKIH
jgi:molybdopterin-biosynthesis enzyme MoeA-like protein